MSSPPLVLDPRIGVKLGDVLAQKYRVERVLGVGGMGVVLLVEHIELGQNMAIKLMLPDHAADTLSVARFLREARAAAGLHSEHVVKIFDVGTLENGAPYMVMELLRGEDLAQHLGRAGRIPPDEAVEYIVQACDALGEAHAMGIVHRDLKPSNLFLCRRSDGRPLVKVLDFGISKAVERTANGTTSAHLTAARAIMGSPLYMSPEQVRDAKQVDARSDIWSLGIVLHELMSGSHAFQADTLPAICAAIIADPPPPLGAVCPDVPEELESVVLRCLEKRPDDRYRDTAQLMDALRPFLPYERSRGVSSARSESSAEVAPATLIDSRNSAPFPISSPESTVVSGRPPPAPGLPSIHDRAAATASPLASSTPSSEPPPRSASRKIVGALLLVAAGLGLSLATVKWGARGKDAASGASVPREVPAAMARKSFALLLDSTPSGADVVEGGEVLGRTPMQLSVDNEEARRVPRRLVLRLPGYQAYSIVQGPSDESLRVIAPLVVAASPAKTEGTGQAPAAQVQRAEPKPATRAPAKSPAAAPAPAIGVPAAPPAAPAPPLPSPPLPTPDIRLQR